MATDRQNKTEQPSQRRLREARQKGDVPRSRDLVSSVGLFLGLFFFVFFIPYMGGATMDFMKTYFTRAGEWGVAGGNVSLYGDFFGVYLRLVLPLFVLLAATAVLVEAVQGRGIRFVTGNFRVRWEKVAILGELPRGLRKMFFSAESLMELARSVVKVVIIGFIAYVSLRSDIPLLLQLPGMSAAQVLGAMGSVFLKLVLSISLFLLLVGGLDYVWQRHRYMKKMKMSRQDLRDELKETEGDPLIRARRKRVWMTWAGRRMMAAVPGADVVIAAPGECAVALQYRIGEMESPKLVAAGKGLMAGRILDTARQHRVPVKENPELARALHDPARVGELIPRHLFKDVADILAPIYRDRGEGVG